MGDIVSEVKRQFRCAQCGKDAVFYISSDIQLFDVVIAGKCSCGNTLQLNYSLVEAAPKKEEADIATDALKEIIEG